MCRKYIGSREKLSSRLGFILISAGCAVGFDNVWRSPYITGQYGEAAFVLLYLVFLILLGLPVAAMELPVGCASQRSAAKSFDLLGPEGTKWHLTKYIRMGGNYLLMMFYTTVGERMINYCLKMASDTSEGLRTKQVGETFSNMLANSGQNLFWIIAITVTDFFICNRGLRNGVEKVSKYMMFCLFIVMLVFVVRAVTLLNTVEGLEFYLIPDFQKMTTNGLWNAISVTMGQVFFTLGLGIDALAIFGSHIGKDRSLLGESLNACILDTYMAFIASLIIFPSCFSFSVTADNGPNLVSVTLPNVFNATSDGRLWDFLFFPFMLSTAITTVIAVFENIIASAMNSGWSRKKVVRVNFTLTLPLSLPHAFGFDLLSFIEPFGDGSTVQDLEGFIVSNNMLSLESLVYLLFCTFRYGWGWKNFTDETSSGIGFQSPMWARFYVSYVLPVVVIYIFFQGCIEKFAKPWNILIPPVLLLLVIYVPLQAWRKKRANNKNT